MTSDAELSRLVARIRAAPALVLLLDYDGTLVPLADVPHLATPDPALLDLLGRLAARPATTVHVVSGRSRETLEHWLDDLPIWLHAEHGFWSRRISGTWVGLAMPPITWRAAALAVLQDFHARTPGSQVEEKTAALAWHYRLVAPALAADRAAELRLHLTAVLGREAVEVLTGEKVIELRPPGVHKGRVVTAAVSAAPAGGLILAMGDDRTDEDLFGALPPGGVAVHVGPAPSIAPVRVHDPIAARELLRGVLPDAPPQSAGT